MNLTDEIDTPRTNALANEQCGKWPQPGEIEAFDLARELEREITCLRAELKASVQVIRGWHGMGMDKELEKKMWEIYWNESPEMKRIQEALAEPRREGKRQT